MTTTESNLAFSENGAYVITSSNRDFDTYYSDNLVDGNENTVWRSIDPCTNEFPQWIELRWDFYPVKLNKLKFRETSPGKIISCSLYWRNVDRWEPVAAHNKQLNVHEFSEVTTAGLKIVFEKSHGPYIQISGLYAYGPCQDLPCLKDGKLYIDDTEPCEEVVVEDVLLKPEIIEPGEILDVEVRLKPEGALSSEYIFVCTIGEKEINPDRSNYTLVRKAFDTDTSTTLWQHDKSYVVKGEIKIPAFAPEGKIRVRIDGLRLLDGKQLRLLNRPMKEISINRFHRKAEPDTSEHNFAVVKEKGIVTFTIDGKKEIPMAFSIQSPSYDRYHFFTKQTGVKIYHLQIYPFRIHGYDYQQRNFSFVDQSIRNLLRIEPEVFVLIEFDLRTSEDWRAAHPNASLLTHDGKKVHESFAAAEYRDEVRDYMKNLAHFINSRSYANHVMGYICEAGEPEGVLSYAGDVGDYNPQAIEAFRDFLKVKYNNSVSDLKNAYKNADIIFETVYPDQVRISEDGENGGVFLNPLNSKMVIDYHEFLSTLIPEFFLENIARVLKEESNREVIVGTYWGYLLEDLTHGKFSHQCTHSYFYKLIDSPYVDFFSSPFNYHYPARHAGDPYLTFQPNDVMKLHGKLQIPEEDHRTFRAGSKERGRNYSQQETIAILKRDWAKAIIRGTGNWLSDWTNYESTPRMAESFFLDDMILDTLKKIRELYKYSMDIPREKTSDIAVFLSGKSYYYHDNNIEPLYKNLITKIVYHELMYLGAPYDIYLFEDIENDFIQDSYKLYIFLNPFYMTEKEREAVESIKRDGKTLLWLYGPGYIRDENGLSTGNIDDVTGIRTGVEHSKQQLQFNITNSTHPVTEGLNKEHGIEINEGPVISPKFYITDTDDSVTVLGQYPDKKTAFAVKDFGDWRSIYSCMPYLPAKILKNIALYSGCHIYVEDEIYIDAEKHYLMLTNGFDCDRDLTVKLPQKSSVYDPFSGKTIAENAQQFSVNIPKCTTLFYLLNNEN